MDEDLRSILAQLFRLSLRPTEELFHILQEQQLEGPNIPQSDHLRKIVQAVLWNRKFILSYYAVVAGIVAIAFTHKTYKNVTRWQTRNRRKGIADYCSPTTESVSSSSSSTLLGISTPPQKIDSTTEITPLIPSDCHTSRRPSVFGRLKAFLLYQPRPIIALTSRVNVLPDNATTISILFFAVVNLFYLLYRSLLSREFIFVLADRAGLLFVANLPILYLLAAKTNQPIKFLTGRSYEGLNLLHRRLGEWMIIYSVIHLLGMLLVFYDILRPLGYTFIRYISSPTIYLGLLAITSYLTIYITSIGWFRQSYYEVFLGLHIVFQFGGLVFLYFHFPKTHPYVIATFAIWAVDRILWRSMLSNRKYIATLEVAPDRKTVLVHCDIDLRRKFLGIRTGLHHGWLPGQHLFLTIPSMGFKHRFQTHPFTIASPAPPTDPKIKSWPLQLVIRSIDGFSLDLLNYAHHHQHCEIILEGPHGGIEALEAAHDADRVCFIAGGSGVAVTYPLAWDHQVKKELQATAMKNLRTIYANGQRHSPPIVDYESLVNKDKFGHFWIRQDPRHSKWITFIPRVGALRATDHNVIDLEDLSPDDDSENASSLITHTFETRKPGFDGGRPDIKGEVWNWVTSPLFTKADLGLPQSEGSSISSLRMPTSSIEQLQRQRICIVVSGPDGLVRDVRNVVAQLVRDGWNVEIWVEKFGW